jgi:plasmid replication initiation protein
MENKKNRQFPLSLFEEQPAILKKPVQAVHMAITGGVQNKTQRLAWNAMLKWAHEMQAKSPEKTIEIFSIPRQELMSLIDYKSPNRKHLKETLTQMQNLKVQWDYLAQDGDRKWDSCVLLPYVGFDKDYIHYSYVPHIKPMLFDPTTYARLDLRIQRKFKLDCAAALYDWCNRFRNNPSKLTNIMTWEEWRLVIYGEINDKSALNEYKIFKRDKLKKAIDEINKESDLEITLVEDKDGGRSVKFLQFVVIEKPMFQVDSDEDKIKHEWDARLEEMGLPLKARKKILATYSVDQINAHYAYTMKRLGDTTKEPLTNVGAYFKNAIENGYAADQVRKEPEPKNDMGAMEQIHVEFMNARNAEAEQMFREMPADMQGQYIDQYNSQQEAAAAVIPPQPSKRLKRHMMPFYSWLARSTWGEPTAQQIFEYAIKKGAIKVAAQ